MGDVCDNCPNLPNRDQLDVDGDQIGDACDDRCAVDGQIDICDGADNDCDGLIDEDASARIEDGVECAAGQLGNCAIGDSICQMVETCIPHFQAEDEICDGYDNDCDGVIDEEVRNTCSICIDNENEICDGLDNDCDGEVDNDAECPEGEQCYDGECRPICRSNECFRADTSCDEMTNLCLSPCDGVFCPMDRPVMQNRNLQ